MRVEVSWASNAIGGEVSEQNANRRPRTPSAGGRRCDAAGTDRALYPAGLLAVIRREVHPWARRLVESALFRRLAAVARLPVRRREIKLLIGKCASREKCAKFL